MSYEKLISCGDWFDEEAELLYMPVSRAVTPYKKYFAGYAHHISESLDYALWLLHTDAAVNKKKALGIIKKAINYQCSDKGNAFFGNWSYFADDGISDIAEDDTSLTCRIAVTLLHIYSDFGSLLGARLERTINEKILNSVYTLLTQYTAQNSFTITLSIYLTIAYGEMSKHLEFIKYGENLLLTLYNSLMYHNSFYEYNDSQHITDQIVFFHRLSQTVKSPYHRRLLKSVSDKSWELLAMHYHPKMRQLTGPFANAVSDCTSPDVYNFLYHAGAGCSYLPHYPAESVYKCACPKKYLPYFKNGNTGFSRSVVFKGITSPYFRQSITESHYMREDYAVGSFSREHFWELKRPFIGYFQGDKKPYCFKLDVLHDFCGYASAVLHSIQYYGNVFGHVSFVTDSGDKHLSMDAPNPSIFAEDLRIRFSISGNIGDLKIEHKKNSLKISRNNIDIYYRVPFCEFDGGEIKYKLFSDNENLYFDAILFSGKKTKIDFSRMKSAIMQFSFLITSTGKKPAKVHNNVENGFLATKAVANNLTFALKTPVKPAQKTCTLVCDEQSVNGIPLENYVYRLTDRVRDITYLEAENHKPTSYFPFLADDKDTSRLLDMIGKLLYVPVSLLSKEVGEIFSQIEQHSYSLELYKRFAIQIVINIFESIKTANGKLSDAASKKHSGIYQKITAAATPEAISDEVIRLCLELEKEPPQIYGRYEGSELVAAAKAIVAENLPGSEVSLTFISERLGYSQSTLSRLFAQAEGMKFSEYLQKKKIDYAISRLKKGNTTITAIAEALGYTSPNNFIRMFKKVKGVTISQYMKQHNIKKKKDQKKNKRKRK